MRLVTVATHSMGYFPYLLKSCERYGATLEVLGWGQKWQGYNWKYLLMRDYLASRDDDEVVCFVDGFDVILLRPLHELEAHFASFRNATGVKVIVGLDRPSNVLFHLLQKWVFGTCRGCSINSGTYIGVVRDLKKVVDDMLQKSSSPSADDQVLMTEFCETRPELIYIDDQSSFFLTVMNSFGSFLTSDMKVTDGRLSFKTAHPFVAHGNGNTHMGDLIRALGYTLPPEEDKRIRNEHYTAMMRKVVYYSKFFVGILIIIAIAVIITRHMVVST